MKDLSQQESHALFSKVARGEMPDSELSTLLVQLKEKGETPAEIAGAAAAFLEMATPFPKCEYEIADCVGTGGDGLGTLNVSTAAMFVAAQMGLKMAKHGSVAVSSKCGSADVLLKAGVEINMTPQVAKRCLDESGVTFLFAPRYHPGMRYAMPVRKALATRTIFNMLGPLINPSRPHIQLTGVYSEALVRPYAETLMRLGLKKGLVVHGSGLDEVAVHGPTQACLIREGTLSEILLTPQELGGKPFDLKQVLGGDAEMNLKALFDLLSGKGSEAYNTLVAVNAGALYWTAGRCNTPKEGTRLAMEVIKSGRARERLSNLATVSHND